MPSPAMGAKYIDDNTLMLQGHPPFLQPRQQLRHWFPCLLLGLAFAGSSYSGVKGHVDPSHVACSCKCVKSTGMGCACNKAVDVAAPVPAKPSLDLERNQQVDEPSLDKENSVKLGNDFQQTSSGPSSPRSPVRMLRSFTSGWNGKSLSEVLCSGDVVMGRYKLVGKEPLGDGWCDSWTAVDTLSDGRRVAVKTFHQRAYRDAGKNALKKRFTNAVATFQGLGLCQRNILNGGSHNAAVALAEGLVVEAPSPSQLLVSLVDFSGSTSADGSPAAAPDGRFYLVFELGQESLLSWLGDCAKRREFVTVEVLRELATMLAQSLARLHGNGLCHLNVKPANIMRFGNNWKLVDVENAVPVSENTIVSANCFTPLYACPEVARAVLQDPAALQDSSAPLTDMSPSDKMDTWAAGVVLLDVLAHESAFQEVWCGFQMEAVMDMTADGDEMDCCKKWMEWLADPTSLVPEDYVQSPASSSSILASRSDLRDLLSKLLAKDPNARLSSAEFLVHPFLTCSGQESAPEVEDIEDACPLCRRRDRVLHDVTVGATHEGWGGKHQACEYDCVRCQQAISVGLSVDACQSCRCFWHPGCDKQCDEAAPPIVPSFEGVAPVAGLPAEELHQQAAAAMEEPNAEPEEAAALVKGSDSLSKMPVALQGAWWCSQCVGVSTDKLEVYLGAPADQGLLFMPCDRALERVTL